MRFDDHLPRLGPGRKRTLRLDDIAEHEILAATESSHLDAPELDSLDGDEQALVHARLRGVTRTAAAADLGWTKRRVEATWRRLNCKFRGSGAAIRGGGSSLRPFYRTRVAGRPTFELSTLDRAFIEIMAAERLPIVARTEKAKNVLGQSPRFPFLSLEGRRSSTIMETFGKLIDQLQAKSPAHHAYREQEDLLHSLYRKRSEIIAQLDSAAASNDVETTDWTPDQIRGLVADAAPTVSGDEIHKRLRRQLRDVDSAIDAQVEVVRTARVRACIAIAQALRPTHEKIVAKLTRLVQESMPVFAEEQALFDALRERGIGTYDHITEMGAPGGHEPVEAAEDWLRYAARQNYKVA